MDYDVRGLTTRPTIDGTWDKAPWTDLDPLAIDRHMGAPPDHRPLVRAKLAYDREAVYVIFRVEDRYVRCVVTDYQGSVCGDSCVEFFFTPGPDVAAGYFNVETNCGGTMLFHFQRIPRQGAVRIPQADAAAITLAHSLPRRVDPELTEPVTWTVEYRLPLHLLRPHTPVATPAPGVTWRANLYKCADKTSHPHWLTWSPVRRPRPDFHVPADFGTLTFC